MNRFYGQDGTNQSARVQPCQSQLILGEEILNLKVQICRRCLVGFHNHGRAGSFLDQELYHTVRQVPRFFGSSSTRGRLSTSPCNCISPRYNPAYCILLWGWTLQSVDKRQISRRCPVCFNNHGCTASSLDIKTHSFWWRNGKPKRARGILPRQLQAINETHSTKLCATARAQQFTNLQKPGTILYKF